MEPSTRPYPSGDASDPGHPQAQRDGQSARRATRTASAAPRAATRSATRQAKPRVRRAPATEPVRETPAPSIRGDAEDTRQVETASAALREAEPEAAFSSSEDAKLLLASDDAVDAAPVAEPGPVVSVRDFEDIFTRFQTPIVNFIYRLVGNREQAHDLAQDVFVKAYRALAGGATIQAGALSSWLYRIASNTATDALRRRRLISWLPLSLFNDDRGVGAGMPGADNGFNQQNVAEERLATAANAFSSGYDGGRFEQRVADREIVERVLQKLPEKYAACLLLYEHEGFSCAEIAEVLNVTPSAVKMRLMRARERFISIYQQEMEGQR